MGKKSRKSSKDVIAKRLAKAQAAAFVPRPYEGLPFEVDLVSLKELVPAATATAKLKDEFGGDEVVIASLLPSAWQAHKRHDGVIFGGLQVAVSSPDPSRDLAAALLEVKDMEPGSFVAATSSPGQGPRLQDILDLDAPFKVRVHETFDYWLPQDGSLDGDEDTQAAIEQANNLISPTDKLVEAEGAYWTEMGDGRYVRWAIGENEDTVMDALARLHADGKNNLGGIGRYLGTFRTQGIVIPVWEVGADVTADDVDAVLGGFAELLAQALKNTEPLSADERRARAGVVSRQLTIR